MSAAYTQATRIIEITTPLGKDAQLLKHFGGNESVSRLFEFDVKLQSLARSVDPNALIGKRATIRVAFNAENTRRRFFNCTSSSFSNKAVWRRRAAVILPQ